MLVSPVMNPVVILSTWYAFNGNYKISAARCGLGILCAVVCGLTYLFKPPVNYLVEDAMPIQAACGDYSLLVEKRTQLSRFSLMMQHAQNEFFSVGKFLLTGIFASTLFQDMIPRAVAAGGAAAPWKALLVMMGLAFVLSLCSSSDAVVDVYKRQVVSYLRLLRMLQTHSVSLYSKKILDDCRIMIMEGDLYLRIND